MQLLSALEFIHSHQIVYNAVNRKSCFLSANLSLLLVGFVDADFVDSCGNRPDRPGEPESTVEKDIWAWGRFYYTLITREGRSDEYI
jgi:hypothetical protein